MLRRLAFAAVALTGCAQFSPAVETPATASRSSTGPVSGQIGFTFKTLDQAYTSFNRMLGINNNGRVVGYYGTGTASDPSVGLLIFPPYKPSNFHKIQYPAASDTVATCLNNNSTDAGYFFDPKRRVTMGFVYANRIWTSYEDPAAQERGDATRLIGLNNAGIAVGYYNTHSQHGAFTLSIGTRKFAPLNLPPRSGTKVVPTGINGGGDIVGYLTARSGKIVGFVMKHTGQFKEFSFPHAVTTKFLGITIDEKVVGSFVDRSGKEHGLLLQHPFFHFIWQPIDDPDAVGSTVVHSINMHDDIVGWYVDGSKRTHGFLATPQ